MVDFRPNQKKIYDFISVRKYSLIVHFMRAGKTYPVCKYIADSNKKVMIVCPPNVKEVWVKHLNDFNVKESKYTLLSSGVLSQSKEGIGYFRKMAVGYDLAVIDEIHDYKAYSNRFQRLNAMLRGIPQRIGLSATPLEDNLHDMFYIIQLLDRGELFGHNRGKFELKYCKCLNPRSTYPKMVFREELIPETMKKLNKFTTTYRPEEIKEPEEHFIRYKLTDEQRSFILGIIDNTSKRMPLPEVMG